MKKWFKAITVGLFVVGEFMEAVRSDGSISVKSILSIGIEAAKKAGYPIADVKWQIYDEDDLAYFKGQMPTGQKKVG